MWFAVLYHTHKIVNYGRSVILPVRESCLYSLLFARIHTFHVILCLYMEKFCYFNSFVSVSIYSAENLFPWIIISTSRTYCILMIFLLLILACYALLCNAAIAESMRRQQFTTFNIMSIFINFVKEKWLLWPDKWKKSINK